MLFSQIPLSCVVDILVAWTASIANGLVAPEQMITYYQYNSYLYLRQQSESWLKCKCYFTIERFSWSLAWSKHWLHFAAPKPVGKHEFSDILNAQGFKPTSDQESQTLSSLKKEQNKPDDPIKAKVNNCTTNHTLGIMDSTVPWAGLSLKAHTLFAKSRVRCSRVCVLACMLEIGGICNFPSFTVNCYIQSGKVPRTML